MIELVSFYFIFTFLIVTGDCGRNEAIEFT